jgi:hypothetical protein
MRPPHIWPHISSSFRTTSVQVKVWQGNVKVINIKVDSISFIIIECQRIIKLFHLTGIKLRNLQCIHIRPSAHYKNKIPNLGTKELKQNVSGPFLLGSDILHARNNSYSGRKITPSLYGPYRYTRRSEGR